MIRPDPRYFLVLAIILVMTFISWWVNFQSLIGIDDAQIYLTYGRNLANGHGFVYNAGGERVEGITSLLWTMIVAVIFMFSTSPEIIIILLSILLVSFALWRMVVYIDTFFGNGSRITAQSVVFLGMIALVPGYFEWTTLSAMESGMWSTLLVLTTLNLLNYENCGSRKKSEWSFCILIFLLLLCRPESMLWCVFFIVAKMYLLYMQHNGEIRKVISGIIPGILTYCVTLGLLITWRINYFGYPLPNTFYAKVSSDIFQNFKLGVLYLYDYIIANPVAIIIVLVLLHTLISLIKSGRILKEFAFLFLTGVVGVTFFIPLYSGGDHFGHFRFIQPLAPVIYLAFIVALSKTGFSLNYTWASLIVLFSFASSQHNFINLKYYGTVNPIIYEWKIAIIGRETSEKLNSFFDRLSKYPTQGVVCTGGTAYAYKGYSYDLLGLNDVQMAHADKVKARNVPKNHASFNKGVFYKHHPDIFWLDGEFSDPGNKSPANLRPWITNVFRNIQEDDQFKNTYQFCSIVKNGTDDALRVFASNSFVASLDTSSYSVTRLRY